MLRVVGSLLVKRATYILFIIHDISFSKQHAWVFIQAFRPRSLASILSQSPGVPQGIEVGAGGVRSRRD